MDKTSRTVISGSSACVVALLMALLVVLARPPAEAAASAAPSSYAIRGAGYGHGVGMSQYGAKVAAERGRTHAQVLSFYYPGTSVGQASGSIRVRISAETSDTLVIASRPGLSVRAVSSGARWPLVRTGASRWRITPSADDRTSRVWALVDRRWRLVRNITGDAEFVAGSLRLILANGSVVYRGNLRSARVGTGRDVVNVVPLDSYLRGVVPREMPALWHQQALRSQAVAARTYAVYERDTTDRGHFDVYDTTRSQVYGGAGFEHDRTDKAIADTRGEIRTYRGAAAFTQFSSSNGGWTVAGSRPYLRAQEDPYDPVLTWTTSVSAARVRAAFPAVGAVQAVRVVARDGRGLYGGRATSVRITGSTTTIVVDGSVFRSRLGLRSTLFRFS